MGLRIVLADDDGEVRECFRLFLCALGHEVRAVGGGLALVAACAADPPDVVVSDVHMPDLDGVSAAEAIRHAGPTPVVLVSGSWDPPTRARAEALAGSWCLDKPVMLPELARAVSAAAGLV